MDKKKLNSAFDIDAILAEVEELKGKRGAVKKTSAPATAKLAAASHPAPEKLPDAKVSAPPVSKMCIRDRKEHRRARYIGRLFQDPMKGTAPSMTVEENLALAYSRGKKRGFSLGLPKKDAAVFRELLATLGLGLEDRMKAKVGLLSGGQRQTVTLLMAVINTPRLLLLDEHTAALDPATADKVMTITREMVARNRITTLMITHNLNDALAIGNRTVMMDEGRVILCLLYTSRCV